MPYLKYAGDTFLQNISPFLKSINSKLKESVVSLLKCMRYTYLIFKDRVTKTAVVQVRYLRFVLQKRTQDARCSLRSWTWWGQSIFLRMLQSMWCRCALLLQGQTWENRSTVRMWNSQGRSRVCPDFSHGLQCAAHSILWMAGVYDLVCICLSASACLPV